VTNSIPWSRIVAEGVVIVISILLAFGIDAWWDATLERGLEREYLTRLEADLESGRTRIDLYGTRFSDVADAVEQLIGRLASSAPIPDTTELVALAVKAGRTGFSSDFLTYDATYQELLSTGNLGVIRDADLRQALVEHFRVARALVEEVQDLPQDYSVRIKSSLGYAPSEYERGSVTMTPESEERLLGAILGRDEALMELRHLQSELRVGLFFSEAITAIDDLLARLSAPHRD